jgi:hypothetical protein
MTWTPCCARQSPSVTSTARGASLPSCTAGWDASSAPRNPCRAAVTRTERPLSPTCTPTGSPASSPQPWTSACPCSAPGPDHPVWAVRYLGDIPADPVDRAEWVRRAGLAAAYREERGCAHETDAIGSAPERGSPEQRASWHAAYTALHLPDERRELAAATDGELWSRRDAYAREAAWAPPYVADELRHAHLAEDRYRADAVRAWYRADAAANRAERAQARQEAEGFSALAQEVGARRQALTEVAEARRRWHAATELTRQQALAADAELRRRHPDTELPPLHPADEPGQPEPDAGADRTEHPPEPATQRLSTARVDLQAALAAARKAEELLAQRQHRADRDAELADADLMRRREAEALAEAAARHAAVRQDPAPSRRAPSIGRDELELEAGW